MRSSVFSRVAWLICCLRQHSKRLRFVFGGFRGSLSGYLKWGLYLTGALKGDTLQGVYKGCIVRFYSVEGCLKGYLKGGRFYSVGACFVVEFRVATDRRITTEYKKISAAHPQHRCRCRGKKQHQHQHQQKQQQQQQPTANSNSYFDFELLFLLLLRPRATTAHKANKTKTCN